MAASANERAELIAFIRAILASAEPPVAFDEHETGWRFILDAAASGFVDDMAAIEERVAALEAARS